MPDAKNPFYELMVKNLDFFVMYLSVHFPFTQSEIIEYWEEIEHGTAHYSVYHSSTESVCTTTPGLCFNQNVRWTDTLRSKWKVGFDDPWNGYLIGVGEGPVEYDDAHRFLRLIPLNISEEITAADIAHGSQASAWGELNDFLESQYSDKATEIEKEYLVDCRHNYLELEKLFHQSHSNFLRSRMIWYNTLYYEINEEEVFSLMRLKRYTAVESKDQPQ